MSDFGSQLYEVTGKSNDLPSFVIAQEFEKPNVIALLVTPAGNFPLQIVRIKAVDIIRTVQTGAQFAFDPRRERSFSLGGFVQATFLFPNTPPREWGIFGVTGRDVLLFAPSQIAGVPSYQAIVPIRVSPRVDPENPFGLPVLQPLPELPVGNPEFPSSACAPVPTVIAESPIDSPCASGSGGTAGPRSFF